MPGQVPNNPANNRVLRAGRVEIIAVDEAQRIPPSWVAFTEEEEANAGLHGASCFSAPLPSPTSSPDFALVSL